LAPSLGVVELTVALHYIFSTPEDKIIWDVGHQAYAHKILTGRRDAFKTIRQPVASVVFPRSARALTMPLASATRALRFQLLWGLRLQEIWPAKNTMWWRWLVMAR
jgi:hypothetical protein